VLAQNKNPVRSEIFFFVCGEAAEAEAPLSCCVVAFFRGFFNYISRTGCGLWSYWQTRDLLPYLCFSFANWNQNPLEKRKKRSVGVKRKLSVKKGDSLSVSVSEDANVSVNKT